MLDLQSWPTENLIEYARNPRKNDHAVDGVAAARWQKFTGKEATLKGDGRTFNEIVNQKQAA